VLIHSPPMMRPAAGERVSIVFFPFEGDAHAALCVQPGEGAGIEGFAGLHGEVAFGPFVALLPRGGREGAREGGDEGVARPFGGRGVLVADEGREPPG
jgi:hypothetical protein